MNRKLLVTLLWITTMGCVQWPEGVLSENICSPDGACRPCEYADFAACEEGGDYTVEIREDFDAGKIVRPPWAMEGMNPTVSEDVSLSGAFSCRCYLPAQLYENARSELRFHGLTDLGKENNYGRNFPFFSAWGIHFAVYVPADFKPDPYPEIWAQFHGDPDSWDNIFTPPFALLIEGYDITVGIRYTDEDPSIQVEKVDFRNAGRITPGAWHHFVVDLNWDYRRGGDGFCRVYLKRNGMPGNDDLIADYSGPMGYHDARGPYFKLGIYKWSWSYPDRLEESRRSGITERLLYYDNIIIRDAPIISPE